MAIVGIDTDRKNPPYTIDDFCIWIPQMAKFIKTEEGVKYFNKIYPMANNKVFYSIYGTDWEYAISLVIAHYITLIGNQMTRPSGSSLAEAAGSGAVVNGVLSSVSVGGFSKSYDFGLTTKAGDDSALFWNQTAYGVAFYALSRSKSVATMFVVTDGNPYENQIDERHNAREPWNMPKSKF